MPSSPPPIGTLVFSRCGKVPRRVIAIDGDWIIAQGPYRMRGPRLIKIKVGEARGCARHRYRIVPVAPTW